MGGDKLNNYISKPMPSPEINKATLLYPCFI